jgi:hypothetical protein
MDFIPRPMEVYDYEDELTEPVPSPNDGWQSKWAKIKVNIVAEKREKSILMSPGSIKVNDKSYLSMLSGKKSVKIAGTKNLNSS